MDGLCERHICAVFLFHLHAQKMPVERGDGSGPPLCMLGANLRINPLSESEVWVIFIGSGSSGCLFKCPRFFRSALVFDPCVYKLKAMQKKTRRAVISFARVCVGKTEAFSR